MGSVTIPYPQSGHLSDLFPVQGTASGQLKVTLDAVKSERESPCIADFGNSLRFVSSFKLISFVTSMRRLPATIQVSHNRISVTSTFGMSTIRSISMDIDNTKYTLRNFPYLGD